MSIASTDKNDSRFERKFLRAPLKSICLYVDGENVFKARTLNISQNGILLFELPHVPEITTIALAINLIKMPRLQTLVFDEVKALKEDQFDRTIIKLQAKMMRTFEGKSNVDKVFINYIGLEFCNHDNERSNIIADYIEVFTKNTIYLLSLFESLGNRIEQLELLRTVAFLLGYDRRMKIPLLRAKVLHDYQSLESL